MSTLLEAIKELKNNNIYEGFRTAEDHYHYNLNNEKNNGYHGHVATSQELLANAIKTEKIPVYYNLSLQQYINAAKELALSLGRGEVKARYDASKDAINGFKGGQYEGQKAIYIYRRTKYSPYETIKNKFGKGMFQAAYDSWGSKLYDLVVVAENGMEDSDDPTILTFYLASEQKINELKQVREEPINGRFVGGNRREGEAGNIEDELTGSKKLIVIDYMSTVDTTKNHPTFVFPDIVVCPITKIKHGRAGNGSDNITLIGTYGIGSSATELSSNSIKGGADVNVNKRTSTEAAMDDFKNRACRQCNYNYNAKLIRKNHPNYTADEFSAAYSKGKNNHYAERKENLESICFWIESVDDVQQGLRSIENNLRTIYRNTIGRYTLVTFEMYLDRIEKALLTIQEKLNTNYLEQ